MRKEMICSLADAYQYYTDCAVATAVDMMLKKSSSKSQVTRLISIAQGMIQHGKEFKVDMSHEEKRLNDSIAFKAMESIK